MSLRPIFGQMSMDVRRLGGAREALQHGNLGFRNELIDYATGIWGTNNTNPGTVIALWPWKMHPAVPGNASDGKVRRGIYHQSNANGYQGLGTGLSQSVRQALDYARMRGYNSTPGSMAQADPPLVFGCVGIAHNVNGKSVNANGGEAPSWNGNLLSLVDLGISQIGAPYMHPVHAGTADTAVGTDYLVNVAGVPVGLFSGHQHLTSLIRIENGPDRGVYVVDAWDRQGVRLHLKNVNGTKFAAQATTVGVNISVSSRTSFFNETNVIPNSTGQVTVDGLFDPGEARSSYIFRLHFAKSGSPSPANAAQTGSYWFSKRGYIWGDGNYNSSWTPDDGTRDSEIIRMLDYTDARAGFFTGVSAGIVSTSGIQLSLDHANQRMWAIFADGTVSSIGYWNYKSVESFREVATTTGVPNDPFASPLALGGQARFIDVGSDGTVYVVVENTADLTKEGWLAIHPDLTWSFTSASTLSVPSATALGPAPVDRTRARTGTAGDTSTSGSTITSASGAFAASDIGRVIKLTAAGADTGSYLVAGVTSGTAVTITNLNGSAKTFAGASGATFQIGDRIYLTVAAEATWNSGKVSYTDSLAFGTRFTQTVTMTNGASCALGSVYGQAPAACVDPVSGDLFWYSTDTATSINRYNVATQAVTQRPLSDLAVQVSGSSSNPTAPTVINAMAVNPNSAFRELWLATDQGHFRFNATDLTAQFHRYYGTNATASTYAESDGMLQLDGSDYQYGTTSIRWYGFLPDGQVFAVSNATAASSYSYLAHFNREADNWFPEDRVSQPSIWQSGTNSALPGFYIDPYGGIFILSARSKGTNGAVVGLAGYVSAIHYQWVASAWVPREVVRGALPDSTSSPGLSAKPLHTTLDDLIHGVKVKFTSSGAVGGENGEFLGRAGQIGTTHADGATTISTNGFVGSGFSGLSFNPTNDLARYFLRIESGADAGVYVIATVTSDTNLTVQHIGGSAVSFTATASSLSYSIWDIQTGAAVGPESCSFIAAQGYAKDNTQDITNLFYEIYFTKTLLSEEAEAVKMAVDVVPPAGSAGLSVYYEAYTSSTAQWSPALGAHLALPGSPTANATQVLDGLNDKILDGTGNRVALNSPSGWAGYYADSSARGYALTIDLGTSVEVGSIVMRGRSPSTSAQFSTALQTETGVGGMISYWYNAPDSGAPVASSSIRCSGTANLGTTLHTNHIDLTSGDFLGTATAVTGSNGQTDPVGIGANIFQAPGGTFSATNVGMVLKITSGTDAGSYRIVSVSGDGSQATIRNLDQTAKVFSAAATGLTYTVFDAVREEDMIAVPSLASATSKFLVERLLSPTSAQVRIWSGTTFAAQNWDCVKPSWNVVKRISHSGMANPPDVFNNGTFTSSDGAEHYDNKDFKVVANFSDLSTATRSGRYWKFAAMPRGSSAGYDGAHSINSIEFLDPTGKKICVYHYNRIDSVDAQAQFLCCQLSRLDFIQASDAAVGAGFNGVAALGGTSGDTVTLGGANKFLGFQVRSGVGGNAPGTSNVFNSGLSDPSFSQSSDVGRFLRILSGVNAGIYRIATVPLISQVTLTTPAGNPVTLSVDAGPTPFTVHEGFNVGTTNPDYICFTTGGVAAGQAEFSLKSVSDDLTTLVINEKQFKSLSNQNWEIRRRAVENRTVTQAIDATLSARLLYGRSLYPYQSGDVCQDSRGHLKFWPGDVGGTSFLNGSCAGGSGVFTGPAGTFSHDDVGRLLIITSGPNKGAYEITTVTSDTQVTLHGHYTPGATVTLTADTSITFRVVGERRFRVARYTTGLRQ